MASMLRKVHQTAATCCGLNVMEDLTVSQLAVPGSKFTFLAYWKKQILRNNITKTNECNENNRTNKEKS